MKRTLKILAHRHPGGNFCGAPGCGPPTWWNASSRASTAEIITQRQFERERDKLRDELAQQYSGADLEAKLNDESKNLLRNLIDQSLMVQKGQRRRYQCGHGLIKKLDQMRKQDNLATIEDLQKDAEQQGS